MADDELLPSDDELEPDDPVEPSDDPANKPPPDDANPAADNDEPTDDEPNEPDDEPQPAARGVPDARQRERRLTRQEEFDRAVDRAVERRISQNQPRGVDQAEQRQQLLARRKQELDDARMQGPEAYADVRDRHLREDYQADTRAREIRDADDRNVMRFERLCDRDPLINSIRREVEEEVQRLKAQGVPTPDREIVADVLLGRRYRERASRSISKQRRTADDSVRRQTVRAPSNLGSQQPAQRRRGARNFAELSVDEMERQIGGLPVRGTSTS